MKLATLITMTVAAVAVSVTNAERGSLRKDLLAAVKELKEEKKNKNEAPPEEEHLELLILDENKDPLLDVDVDVGKIIEEKKKKKQEHGLQSGGTLTVLLDKATGLADDDGISGSDPYAEIHVFVGGYVLYSDHDYGTQTSTTIDNTENPVWDETFTFPGIESLDDLVLEVTVYDSDIGFDDTLGSCEVKLDEMNLSSTPTAVTRVIDAGWIYDSKIYLEISYSP